MSTTTSDRRVRRLLSRLRTLVNEPSGPVELPLPASGCLAPATSMYLAPDGHIRACCRNFGSLGHISDQPLLEIWNGERRRAMVADLTAGRYRSGCDPCGVEVAVEGRRTAYPANFDRLAADPVAAAGGLPEWPSRIEFNLSNTCNLMCIQCDSLLSSMVRLHREHLPPLPKVYGDAFFEELREFIPHLREVQFAGGEPFLAKENYRVWSLIEELNPGLTVSVVTNATQWNDRVEAVARSLRMGFTFSIDGISKETYEGIRVHSDFDTVMTNIDRYLGVARDNGRSCEVNFCLMRQNHHEFAELLLWAESHRMPVNVCVVRSPEDCSVAALPADELKAVADALWARDAEVRPLLRLNQGVWIKELDRIRAWAEAGVETQQQLWWSESWQQEPVPVTIGRPGSSLGLTSVGTPQDTSSVADEAQALVDWCGSVHRMEFDFDANRDIEGDGDHLLTGMDPSVGELLQLDPDEWIGRPVSELFGRAVDLFGTLSDVALVEEGPKRSEFAVTFAEADVRTVAVPHRSDRGKLLRATLLFALRPR